MLNSEEDIKIKVVIKHLRELGFTDDEFTFEGNFTIHAGKKEININTQKHIKDSYARYDILITRNNKNLCIVEVKKDNNIITEKEIKQASSYALLTRSPFFIITNGKEWNLFDTVQNKEIKTGEVNFKNDYKFCLEPEESIYRGLKNFISYSVENLITFCKNHVEKNMEVLIGDKITDGKYIPEIYQSVKELAEKFDKFINSKENTFALIASSGMGKTNWICNTATKFIKNGYPCLFYRAAELNNIKSLPELISIDLDWSLPPKYQQSVAVNKFFNFFEEYNKPIIIFFDGLDEAEIATMRRVINDFYQYFSKFNIKLVITCKEITWKYFLKQDGIKTKLSNHVLNSCYKLDYIKDEDFYPMLDKYEKFYNYYPKFAGQTLQECKRSPFLLHLLFKISFKKKLKYVTSNIEILFKEYLKIIMERFEEEEDLIENLLIKISGLIYEENDEKISLDLLLNKLNIPIYEKLPEKLFTLNILEKQEIDSEKYIRFYFSKLRDYLISYKYLKLNRLSYEALEKLTESINLEGIKLEVFNFYYSICSKEHKRVFDKDCFDFIVKYLKIYKTTIDENFINFKSSFPPYTLGDIGFVGYFDLVKKRVNNFSLIEAPIGEDKILLFPDLGEPHNITYIYGSNTMESVYPEFHKRNVEKVAINDVYKNLLKIIDKGNLNESNNLNMLIEKVFNLYVSYINKENFELQHEFNFPISLKKIKEETLYKRAYEILDLEYGYYSEQEEKNKYNIKFKDGISIFEINMEEYKKEKLKIEKKSFELSQKGEFLETTISIKSETEEDRIYRTIIKDIDLLLDNGIEEISKNWGLLFKQKFSHSIFFPKNGIYPEITNDFKNFIADLYKLFLDEYKTLIEKNFPEQKNQFKLYSIMPVRYFVHSFKRFEINLIEKIEICSNNKNLNEVVLCDYDVKHDDSVAIKTRNIKDIFVEHNGEKFTHFLHIGRLIDYTFNRYYNYFPFKKSNLELNFIRSLVYDQIKDEIEKNNIIKIIKTNNI